VHRLPFLFNVLQTVPHYYAPAWNRLRDAIKARACPLMPHRFPFSLSLSLSLA